MHWVKRTINGHDILLNKMVNIYYSVTTTLAWYSSSLHCIMCMAEMPASEDIIHLILKSIQMSSKDNPSSIIKLSVLSSTVRIKDCTRVQLRYLPRWALVTGDLLELSFLADSDTVFFPSFHGVHIFHEKSKCCKPLFAMVHMPLPFDILTKLW